MGGDYQRTSIWGPGGVKQGLCKFPHVSSYKWCRFRVGMLEDSGEWDLGFRAATLWHQGHRE